MLTKDTVVTVRTNDVGVVFVARVDRILEDGVVVAVADPHVTPFAPGDDITGEDPTVQGVCAAVWTPAVVTAYRRHAMPVDLSEKAAT